MDFNGSIAPLVFSSKLFGLAPFSGTRSALGFRYRKSRPALVLSVLGVVAMVVVMQLALPIIKNYLCVYKASWVIYVSNVLQELCGILLFTYTHVAAFLTRDRKLATLAKFSKLSSVLGQTSVSHTRTRRFMIAQLLFLGVCVVTGSGLYVAGAFRMSMVLRMAVICVTTMSNTLAETHFTNSVAKLWQLLVCFNEKLSGVEAHGEGSDVDVDGRIQSVLGFARGRGPSHWALEKRPWLVATGQESCVDFLRHHETLFQLAVEINSMYGLQNLLVVSQSFLYQLNMLYAIVDSAFHSGSGVLRGAVIFSVTLQAVRLLIHVGVCESAVRQMDVFSAQLLHRRIQFNACSMIPLDPTLIYSIVGGVTSYLVILIQFQYNSPQ